MPAPRTTVLAYKLIEGPLKEILELEKTHSVDLTCKEVLEDVSQKSKNIQKETVEELLASMLDRPLYNRLEVLNGRTEKVDFLGELHQ